MRILFFDDRIPYLLKGENNVIGGATIRLYALAKGLTSLGHSVAFLTWNGANAFANKKEVFELIESYDQSGGIKGIRFFARKLSMLKSAKAYKPDVVLQISAAINTGVLAYVAKWLKVPAIFLAASNADADGEYKDYLSKSAQKLYEYGVRNADLIVCQNSYQNENFKCTFPKTKRVIIHNPYFYEGELPEILSKSKRKYIAWVGNFSIFKNVPAAYEVIKALPEVLFKLAGKETHKTDNETKKALEKLKALKNVEFVGHIERDEILDFLGNAYALFNTSIFEGFSNTFLEAFAAGTPIVTREKIDPDDIIAKNGLGIIVNESNQIAAAISKLIADENFDTMAQKCQTYLVNNHTSSVIAKQLEKSLLELVSP